MSVKVSMKWVWTQSKSVSVGQGQSELAKVSQSQSKSVKVKKCESDKCKFKNSFANDLIIQTLLCILVNFDEKHLEHSFPIFLEKSKNQGKSLKNH